MHLPLIRFLLALALLAGCTAPPVAPPSSATPAAASSAATNAPGSPTPVSAVAPTSGPSGSISRQAVLPAPLYVLDRGQVARIERDGVTRAQVTRERVEVEGYPPISAFDAGPGGIAYVVGDLEADRLSRADGRGGEPQLLYSEGGHELSDIVWSPDGRFIYLRLLNNKQPPDIPAGIYRVPAAGGELELVQADDPVDDPANPSRSVSGYRPFAFAPDGATLLVEAFSLFYEDCALAVMPANGSPPARITLPTGVQTYCGEAAWAPDGTVLLLAGPPADQPGVGPTVWRAPASGGAATELGSAELLARAPIGLPGGLVRFFQVRLPADPAGPATFAPTELTGAGQARELLPPFSERLALARWAADGSGAVVVLESEQAGLIMRWLPLNGQPLDLPHTGDGIRALRWAAE